MTGLTRFEITHYDKFHHISAKLYHHYVKYQVLGRNQVTTTMQGQQKDVGHGGTRLHSAYWLITLTLFQSGGTVYAHQGFSLQGCHGTPRFWQIS